VVNRAARVEVVGKVSINVVLDQFSQHLCNLKSGTARKELTRTTADVELLGVLMCM
jgi:hypothetical protein